MPNTSETETIQSKSINWHKVAKKAILICQLLMLIFVLCIVATVTMNYAQRPYTYFFVGIEVCIALMLGFTIIRMNTFKPAGKLRLPGHFTPTAKEAELLWFNISYDINRYEEGSSYYYNGVKAYKYTTILLSGLSTIVLGLDLGNITIGWMDYPVFSKNVALVIGAIVTVTTALFTYWNIEKYWLINKTIVNKLRALRDDLEIAFAAGTLDGAAIQMKVEKYNEIKETFNKYWEGALSERSSQSGVQNANGAGQ